MNILKYGIGIDVSMQKFDVCLSAIDIEQKVSIKATHQFSNNQSGFKLFHKWVSTKLKEPVPVVILLEATGIYHEQLSWYLHSQQYKVCIILPNKAKKYKESLGLKSKNDSIDANGLSRMACEQYIKEWSPVSKQLYILRILTRQIEKITVQITTLANQLHALELGMYRDKTIEKMYRKHIASLEKIKEQILQRIDKLVADDEVLSQKISCLTSVKGVGLLAAVTVVAETNGFALIENQSQLVSYAGYDVVENQSGNRTGRTRISKHGNSHIRRVLHFPALIVVRYKVPDFVEFYNRIQERSGIKMKGYVAVQKKLLIILYTLWKKNEHYNFKMKSEKPETEFSFSLPSQKALKPNRKKVAPKKSEATQDEHPTKHRRKLSFS